VPIPRDPLSVRYDGVVDQLLRRAGAAHRYGRGVQAWIASPREEFRHRDRGGRTAHERAFSRSAYYKVFRVPLNQGRSPDWSLKLEWGSDAERRASSGGRLARPVRVRLFKRSGARVSGPRWVDDPARQSKLGPGGERIVGG
jgi:hypothetical protein